MNWQHGSAEGSNIKIQRAEAEMVSALPMLYSAADLER